MSLLLFAFLVFFLFNFCIYFCTAQRGSITSSPPTNHPVCLISLFRTSSWKWRPTSWGQTCLTLNMMISLWYWMSSAGTPQGQRTQLISCFYQLSSLFGSLSLISVIVLSFFEADLYSHSVALLLSCSTHLFSHLLTNRPEFCKHRVLFHCHLLMPSEKVHIGFVYMHQNWNWYQYGWFKHHLW